MPSSVFQINGVDVLHPGKVLRDFDRLGFDSSDFSGRANSFTMQRGASPSFGYFIMPNESVDAGSDIVLTVHPMEWEFLLKIEWQKTIGKAATQDNWQLVKVVDDRYTLAGGFVGKRYNYVLDYLPAITSNGKGSFVYHEQTLKEGDAEELTPYAWEDLFKEVWKIKPDLNISGAVKDKFPKYYPVDLDWRYVPCSEALERLCQWTNTTVIFDPLEQKWKLVLVEGTFNLDRLRAFQVNSEFMRYKEAGNPKPKMVRCYFERLDRSQRDVDEYLIIEKNTTPTGIPSTTILDVRLPMIFPDAYDTPVKCDDVAEEFMEGWEKRWEQFPPQEKTFSGFQNLSVSGLCEEVIFYQYDDHPYTHILSVNKQPCVIIPEWLDRSQLYMLYGTVMGNVSSQTATIQVRIDKIINGRVPEGTQGVLCPNVAQVELADGAKVFCFQRRDSNFWYAVTTGGTGGGLTRFEIIEDKMPVDYACKAIILGNDDLPVLDNQGNPFPIWVGDAWSRFHGWKAWNDPLYGPQRGYRGKAQFLFDGYFGASLYEIVEMEHSARYVEATHFDANASGGGSGGGGFGGF